eukprot:8857929-Pyramimonas_sp.AAC.1
MSFWLSVKQAGFAVPTNGKPRAIAGRWQRRLKADPELKARCRNVNRTVPCLSPPCFHRPSRLCPPSSWAIGGGGGAADEGGEDGQRR